MTNGKTTIERNITRTKAGAAEGAAQCCTALKYTGGDLFLDQLIHYRLTCRVDVETEALVAYALSSEDIRCPCNIFKQAPCAAGNDALIHMQLSVDDFGAEVNFQPKFSHLLITLLLGKIKNVLQVVIQFVNGISVTGVEG